MARLPAPVLALAERQHGVVARHQLRPYLTADAVDGYVRRGHLVRLEVGVYRIAGVSLPEQQPFAASLRARPNATVTGPFVLGHLRVDGFTSEDDFEVLLQPNRQIQNVRFSHREDPFPDRAVTEVGSVRLASPADALIETALWRPAVKDRQLRVAYDQLRWRGLITTERFSRRLEERGGDDPAVSAFVAGLDRADVRAESEGERSLGVLLSRFDPAPEPQVWITPRRRLDFFLRALRLGWEYLGGVDHTSTGDRARDAERDREVEAQGIRLLYVTDADLRSSSAFFASTVSAVTVRADELGLAPPRILPA